MKEPTPFRHAMLVSSLIVIRLIGYSLVIGINPTLVQLLMTKNNEPVVKHIAARLSGR